MEVEPDVHHSSESDQLAVCSLGGESAHANPRFVDCVAITQQFGGGCGLRVDGGLDLCQARVVAILELAKSYAGRAGPHARILAGCCAD
jgi:hypothetical protein